MLNVVFDTVGFVRSLINPSNYWGRIIFQYTSSYQLIVSREILIEIIEVLKRSHLVTKYNSLQDRDVDKILQILAGAKVVKATNIEPVSRDPDDDKFLATAKSAKADYLVSADKDLLDLEEYAGIKIITAETFLKILE